MISQILNENNNLSGICFFETNFKWILQIFKSEYRLFLDFRNNYIKTYQKVINFNKIY